MYLHYFCLRESQLNGIALKSATAKRVLFWMTFVYLQLNLGLLFQILFVEVTNWRTSWASFLWPCLK
jgi:hypothetical protein